MSVVKANEIPAGYEGNDPAIEKQFAVKCIEHAEAYWKLVQHIKASTLKLTRHDAELLASFRETFPVMFEGDHLAMLREDIDLKSEGSKATWRKWIKEWETKIDDYNYGTLLRVDCKQEYTEANSIFVTRIQFFAVEIARNQLGLNDWAFEEQGKSKKAKTGKR